jgi:hypothetical protein
MLEHIENAIVARIIHTLDSPNIKVAAFPEKAKEFDRPNPTGQVLIGYKRSVFKMISEQPLTMHQDADFELSLQFQDLRSHVGAYPILDRLRVSLLGFIPIQGNVKGLRPVSENFADLDNGTWYYNAIYRLPLIHNVAFNPYQPNDPWDPSDPWDDPFKPLPDWAIDPDQNEWWRNPEPIVSIRSGTWVVKRGTLPQTDQSRFDREFVIQARPE